MCGICSHAIAGTDPRKAQGSRGSRQGEEAGIINFNGSLVLYNLKMTVEQYVKCFVRVDLHELGHE